MILLYNSDAFTVMQVDLPQDDAQPDLTAGGARTGIEIVDKSTRQGLFLDGESAREFRANVQALVDALEEEDALNAEDIDAHLARYTGLGGVSSVLH